MNMNNIQLELSIVLTILQIVKELIKRNTGSSKRG